MKFCKDCKYLCGVGMCKSPKLGQDIVTGKVRRYSATVSRNMESMCGLDGYWFESKPASKLREVLAWLAQR